MRHRLLLLAGLLMLLTVLPGSAALTAAGKKNNRKPTVTKGGKNTFTTHIRPFLKKYCTNCHGGRRPRADLNLEKFTSQEEAFKHREVWDRVAEMLQSGEMPPPKKRKPALAEVEKFTDWIDKEVNKVDCTLADPGRVTIRRLNKVEYNNTIRDLIGLDLRPARDFPDDDVGYGFDNIGDVLSLSPLLLEKYLKASDKIVKAAFQLPSSRRRILIRRLDGKNDKQDARVIISAFAERAYRRPVKKDEVDRLMKLVDLARKKGDPIEKGIKLAVQATLVSPHFLFRIEQDRPVPKGKAGHPINEFELASRLSYFLWSTMPDEELFRQAKKGELRKHLDQQIRRMLRDEKAQALAKNFAGQWLGLRNLRRHHPDPDAFPTFNKELRSDMIRETELFFAAIMKEDRNIMEFLDADFTFVNERLAKHYGISGVKGNKFRRVSLKNSVRGGVLTQASILTLTSNPTRTSPVLRGKWILENILDSPPPPPPPSVPELAEGKKAALTGSLRKRMELHRMNAICASCHQKMDPLGFGLENFDGIGAYRTRDGKFPIDASGVLPTGQKFNGPQQLRRVLLKTKAKDFRRCLVEKMLTYALGRGLEHYDRCALEDIFKTMDRHNNRFSSMVSAIIHSDPFQKRRGARKR